MKKLFLLLSLVGVFFTSCESGDGVDDNGNTPSIPQIELSQQIVEVNFEAAMHSVTITSPYSWKAESKNDWIILKTESGISGTKELKFSVELNEELEIREGTIALQNEDVNLYAELYVSQSAFVPEITISSELLQYEFEGGKQELIVTSNFEYDVIEDCEWLSFEKTEKGINLIVEASTITETRNTEIVISNEKYSISKKITVEQKAFEPSIEVESTEVAFNMDGGTIDVMFVANAEYEISCSEDWVSYSSFVNEQEQTGVKISAAKSTITEERVAEVVISLPNYNVSKTIKVSQKAFEPSLEVDITELEFDADGGYKYVTITANTAFSISEDASWISYTKSENNVKITVSTSTITEERNAEVTIYLQNYDVSRVVKVIQKAFVPSLELDVEELEFEAEGGYKYVNITANTTFSVSEDASWITYTKYSNSVRIAASTSTTTNERSANITIYLPNYDVSKVVKVTQKAFVPTLSVDVSELSFEADGGSMVANITTNVTFYSVSVDADWVSYTKNSNNKVTITAAASLVAEERNANVTITLPNYGINKVIKVTQKAFEPILLVEDISTLEFDYNGGERIVSVTSNFDYQIDSAAEWIVYEKNTNGIKLTIAPNYVMESRSATLAISGKKYNFADKVISISQTTMPTDYTVIEYTTDFGGIVAPYNAEAFGDAQIVSNTYENGKGVLKFDIPLTKIGSQAFYNSQMTSVSIPDKVVSIGSKAFYGCSKLGCISISNSVTSIGSSAFYGCSSLNDLVIPNGVSSIGSSAFYNCKGLKNITIGNSVTSIGSDAFSGCSNLVSVNASDLTSWCKINFNSTTSNPIYYTGNLTVNGEVVKNIVIPSDITSISDYAFYNCGNINTVNIHDNVTYIGAYAFYNCDYLSEIYIGQCVDTVETAAFWGCDNLYKIYCKAVMPPKVYYGSVGYTRSGGSFPFNSGMTIYVARNSYNSYMQFTSSSVDRTSQDNWCVYDGYIQPYDFE